MRVKCIDNDGHKELLQIGKIYPVLREIERMRYNLYSILYNDVDIGYFNQNRFETLSYDNGEDITIGNKNDGSLKYWYYIIECINASECCYEYTGVISSNKNTFPIKDVEEYKKSEDDIISLTFKLIIEIDREDYEYKYAEMSKFRDRKGE